MFLNSTNIHFLSSSSTIYQTDFTLVIFLNHINNTSKEDQLFEFTSRNQGIYTEQTL